MAWLQCALAWTDGIQWSMIPPMEPVNESLHVRAWREHYGISLEDLAQKAGLAPERLQAIEHGECDCSLASLHRLSHALDIPVTWLLVPPTIVQYLQDHDRYREAAPPAGRPLAEYLARGIHEREDLFLLLTALVQHGDPKLLRAAEVNLRSLLKQARTATLPWQARPSGHFEPPSD